MDANQLIEDVMQSARVHGELVQSGINAAEQRMGPAMRNAVACYRKALKDSNTVMPTYLHAALEALSAVVPAPKQ